VLNYIERKNLKLVVMISHTGVFEAYIEPVYQAPIQYGQCRKFEHSIKYRNLPLEIIKAVIDRGEYVGLYP
jgi:hypothetical protein